MQREIPDDRVSLTTTPTETGLSESEVLSLRARFGTNEIAEQLPKSWLQLARDAAGDPMIWFLLLTSGLFGIIGQLTDMAVLLAAILPLVGMDFYLHRRTQASIEGLSGVLASTALVIRNGERKRLASAELVPGDVAVVEPGNPFPGDGLIAAGEALQAEESSLTGEAYPVLKHAWRAPAVNENGLMAEETNWAFAGTRLLTGEAVMRVIFTGSDTLYGEVVRSAVSGPQGRTPLQRSVTRLVRALLIVAAIICILLAIVRLRQGFGPIDALLSAATLAVAAIPEEFPVVLTFFLGVGVFRLAKRKALVRRAVAVENIGRVSVICTDKTGTITEGRLALRDVVPAKGVERDWLMRIGSLASRRESGDPLDNAILDAGPPVGQDWVRLQLFPFTEDRRRETAVWRSAEGAKIVATKGAAEQILDLCEISPADREYWLERILELSAAGQKVIGCAWRDGGDEPEGGEPIAGFRFAGVNSFSDPLRAGVRQAVETARASGIQIIMITGDNPHTAAAIAREAGIAERPVALLGDRLRSLVGEMSPEQLGEISVVARASPAQKLFLVETLQKGGRIVAVTGDGVNDVPALRAADIGIAMGLRGTRSAREVSAIVLLDDNFRTIISAIAEGRQLFRNLTLSFAFLLMIHIPLVASAALIPFLGFPLLYLPVHIVWLELLIHPAAILAFQRSAVSGLSLVPEPPSRAFFSSAHWVMIVVAGAAITAVILGLFIFAVQTGQTPEYARASALAALTIALGGLVAVLTRLEGAAAKGVAAACLASSLLLTCVPSLAVWVHLEPLSITSWLVSAVAGLLAATFAVPMAAKPTANSTAT